MKRALAACWVALGSALIRKGLAGLTPDEAAHVAARLYVRLCEEHPPEMTQEEQDRIERHVMARISALSVPHTELRNFGHDEFKQ